MPFSLVHVCDTKMSTVDGFIFVGTNFRGLIKNYTFVGFKFRGHSIFFHNSCWKLPFRGYWNSWIGPSTKTTKIGTPRNLSHPQYAWLKFEKGNLSKYARQRWRALHLIHIDQVKNIIFLDKIQKGLVVIVVLSITSTLGWFIVSCSTVFINSKRK